jgi:hypothetical protein
LRAAVVVDHVGDGSCVEIPVGHVRPLPADRGGCGGRRLSRAYDTGARANSTEQRQAEAR